MVLTVDKRGWFRAKTKMELVGENTAKGRLWRVFGRSESAMSTVGPAGLEWVCPYNPETSLLLNALHLPLDSPWVFCPSDDQWAAVHVEAKWRIVVQTTPDNWLRFGVRGRLFCENRVGGIKWIIRVYPGEYGHIYQIRVRTRNGVEGRRKAPGVTMAYKLMCLPLNLMDRFGVGLFRHEGELVAGSPELRALTESLREGLVGQRS